MRELLNLAIAHYRDIGGTKRRPTGERDGSVARNAEAATCVRAIEATARKCEFIERAIEAAALSNARVVCRRAEEWAGVRAGLLLQDIVPITDESPYEDLLRYETEARALGYPELQ